MSRRRNGNRTDNEPSIEGDDVGNCSNVSSLTHVRVRIRVGTSITGRTFNEGKSYYIPDAGVSGKWEQTMLKMGVAYVEWGKGPKSDEYVENMARVRSQRLD